MSVTPRLRVVASLPPELVVYDEPGTCSYLESETWRLPLRLPVRPLTREEFGARLAEGDRRQGRLLYRTACPSCRACEPIRIDVTRFEPSKTQRRVLRRGDEAIEVQLGPPVVDPARVRLYNLHKLGRDLAKEDRHTNAEAYRSFLGESCCETFEMRYLHEGELFGVALVDRADDALSAVYFYWDPALAKLSPGTYSVLKQLELCRQLGLRYLYLGLYIAACEPMAYKARFVPHERLVDGAWREHRGP
jgi:arginyl-tRNA--protein-N-Asp/Glu arginylyltransferase